MGLSMSEILVIAAVVLLLFGSRKIPELARSLGRASYEFKKAKQDLIRETEELTDAAEKNAEKNAEKTASADGNADNEKKGNA